METARRQQLETTFPGSPSQAVEGHVDVTSVPFTPHQLFSLLPVPWPLGSIRHCSLQSGNTHQGQGAHPVLLPSSSWCPFSAVLGAPVLQEGFIRCSRQWEKGESFCQV